jgi:hypothetical protein
MMMAGLVTTLATFWENVTPQMEGEDDKQRWYNSPALLWLITISFYP